jgi:hypothetical protein
MTKFALIVKWFWSDVIFRPFRVITGFSNHTFGLFLSHFLLVSLAIGLAGSSTSEIVLNSLTTLSYFGHIQAEAAIHRPQNVSEISSIQTRIALLTIITTVAGVLTLIINLAQGGRSKPIYCPGSYPQRRCNPCNNR